MTLTSAPVSSLPAWIVLRFDLQLNAWQEVGCTHAATAGDAFRHMVLPPSRAGEYRIFALDGSAHLGVEWTLRDLTAERNPRELADEPSAA